MITLYRASYQVEPRAPEFFGLSTDVKPTTVSSGATLQNGAYFTEVDTGVVYRFDAQNIRWIEQP